MKTNTTTISYSWNLKEDVSFSFYCEYCSSGSWTKGYRYSMN